MVSTRKFVGKLSAQQAVRLVMGKEGKISTGLQPRIGRRVQLDSTAKSLRQAPEQKKGEQARVKWLEWIHEKWVKSRTPKRRLELQKQRELLRLLHLFGQRKPTAHQIAATLAFRYGLERNTLLPALNILTTIEKTRPQFMDWSGQLNTITKAVRMNLPYKIEQLLSREKRILDGKEIAESMSIDWNTQNQNLINVTMQTLHQMSLIEKEPMHSRIGKTPITTWAHRKYGPLEIRHPNSELQILESIFEKIKKYQSNKITVPEISAPRKKKQTSKFRHETIHSALVHLQAEGLIKLETKTKPTTIKGTGKSRFFVVSLSPEGIKLMQEFYRRGRTSFPSIRRYLLGVKEQ